MEAEWNGQCYVTTSWAPQQRLLQDGKDGCKRRQIIGERAACEVVSLWVCESKKKRI